MSASDRTHLLSFRDDDDNDELGRSPPSLRSPLSSFDRHVRQQLCCQMGVYLKRNRCRSVTVICLLTALVVIPIIAVPLALRHGHTAACSTIEDGYICNRPYSILWGQYSPYFSLAHESQANPRMPGGCTPTFAQLLSRHGARYPTAPKSAAYAALIRKIQSKTTEYSKEYAFLRNFTYDLGADDLTAFGRSQLVDSGTKFYRRYLELARESNPFVRAAGSDRVIASADFFINGFHDSKKTDPNSNNGHIRPELSVIISEEPGSNNTLDHGECKRFEDDHGFSEIEKQFGDAFVPAILSRVNSNLVGADLTAEELIYLMDLCPYQTVADTPGATDLSPFCSLFSLDEWTSYDYLRSLEKYYHHGPGNLLGATQGVGFVNELIARLTRTPVKDSTTVNHTLDCDPKTFPLDRTLYADFSHDNIMVSIFTALGLFNSTPPLLTTAIQTPEELNGYAASWAVPFGAHAYVEKMKCNSTPALNEEYVRILLNDRVVPLHGCAVDDLGRCRLDDFVAGLSFARNGGDWAQCSVPWKTLGD